MTTSSPEPDHLWLILFDCDGTLVDSKTLIVRAMQTAFEKADQKAPSPRAIERVIGLSLSHAISNLGLKPGSLASEISNNFKVAYAHHRDVLDTPEPLFSGAGALIQNLAAMDHILLGIATGKSKKGVESLFERHHWHNHFITIQTADNAPSKPHPGMIEAAMAETGIDRQRTIMIGDTSYDMEMARAAGSHAIAVTWGHHEIDELSAHGPQHIVETMQELSNAINAMTNFRIK